MAEKYSSRTRYQRPPISRIIHQPQRSRSVSNGLEREPKLQPVRVLERQLSVITNLNVTPIKEQQRSKVAQIIEQFERSKSTENIHQSIKNLQVTPSIARYTPVRTVLKNSKI